MSFKVLISDPVDPILIEILEDKGCSVTYLPEATAEDVRKRVAEFDAIVVRSRTKINGSVIGDTGRLKLVARAGIGLDTIDTDFLREKDVGVVYAPGESTESVAELAVSLMIMGSRNIFTLSSRLRNGIFDKEKGSELRGRTLGVIGFGRIGFRTAEIARALGMNIIAYDIFRNDDLMKRVEGRYCSLEELLQSSDFISLFITMKKGDQPLLDGGMLSRIRRGAIVVNTSRAAAIDGKSLLSSLRNGSVSFYGADVLWNEPPREGWEHELISLENVVITPHIGAQTVEAQERIARRTASEIIEYLERLQ